MSRNRNSRFRHIQDQRKKDIRSARTRFLIVCEGEKTEPYYFERFPLASADITIIGEGYNTISLVNYVIKLRKEIGYIYETDHVWCVFDKDDFSDNDFNAAIQKAEAAGINVAYSNEAFELWYLLHFDKHESALHRNQYVEKLTEKLQHRYKKNNGEMYPLLKDSQPIAIKRARELYETHTPSPANDNPSTTVFLLVEELNKHIKGNY